jgi:hypothetical protein
VRHVTPAIRQASLRITISALADVGSPEFTQFFNHGHPWKLQFFCLNSSAIKHLVVTKLM